nr:DUF1450 domain-containing protein [Peribacillus alkalitolerans]
MFIIKNLLTRKKKIQIDFCETNLDRYLTKNNFLEFQSFLNQKHVQYNEYACQSRCKECQKSPYAIVDGKILVAESSTELLEKLKTYT